MPTSLSPPRTFQVELIDGRTFVWAIHSKYPCSVKMFFRLPEAESGEILVQFPPLLITVSWYECGDWSPSPHHCCHWSACVQWLSWTDGSVDYLPLTRQTGLHRWKLEKRRLGSPASLQPLHCCTGKINVDSLNKSAQIYSVRLFKFPWIRLYRMKDLIVYRMKVSRPISNCF